MILNRDKTIVNLEVLVSTCHRIKFKEIILLLHLRVRAKQEIRLVLSPKNGLIFPFNFLRQQEIIIFQ